MDTHDGQRSGPFAPLEIAPGVYQLRVVGARVTAMLDDRGVVLVDAGGAGSGLLVAAGLRTLGCSTSDIRLAVLTHYHPDHSGGLRSLLRRSKASIAAHAEEAPVIGGEVSYPSPFKSPLLGVLARPVVWTLAGGPVKVDHLLRDGDLLPTAEQVQVIHTPGHTPGSICLYLESEKLLIVGDALQHAGGVLSPPATHVTWDAGLAMQSLRKLAELDFETICFSHYPPLKIKARETLHRLTD